MNEMSAGNNALNTAVSNLLQKSRQKESIYYLMRQNCKIKVADVGCG